MLYLPSVFGDGFMNDFFDDLDRDFFDEPMPVRRVNGHSSLMRTDITKKNGNYELAVELPGYKKDDVSLELENGYLNISAKHNESKEEKNDKGEVIRSERYAGNMARSFYVGDDVKEEDVKAKFEDGILKVTIPDKENAKEIPAKKTIMIE
ncbi:MAG: Hsp20/alpha crystallin family protein [Lachnospiraceae bacterium]|jgi:HSP20 family protein|nr:Hsp20/alpha crystallin family protein [Lachnospiraceae bacterium]